MKVKLDGKDVVISFAEKFGISDYVFSIRKAIELRDKLYAVLPIKKVGKTIRRKTARTTSQSVPCFKCKRLSKTCYPCLPFVLEEGCTFK